MERDDAEPVRLARAEFTVQGQGFSLALQATVPAGPARQSDLLPLARAIADTVVAQTQQAVEAAGQRVSCSRGCAACCRSLVPLAEVEARRLHAVVAALPEPRRGQVQARFDSALAALARAGVLGGLQQWAGWSQPEYQRQVAAYFAACVPCPFLEDESCSIYDERPLTCREFLVTSPARHCGELGSDQVRPVALPVKMFNAVARWQPRRNDDVGEVAEGWVPLVLALEWAAQQPHEAPIQEGPALLRDLLGALNG